MKRVLLLLLTAFAFQFSFAQWTTSGTNIYNSNTGNVGIGSTNPSAKLHISGGQVIETSGSSSNTRTLTLMNAGTSQLNFGSYNGSWRSALQIQNNNATKALFFAPPETDYNYSILRSINGGVKLDVGGTTSDVGVNALTIETSGNIGIGATSPSSKLEVAGEIKQTGRTTYLWGATSSQNQALMFSGWGIAHGGIYWRGSTRTFTLNTGDNADNPGQYGDANFSVTGNVGIGTIPQTAYKLAVNGDAIFTKVKVKTYATWPDYVFHRNYKLRPLHELETYINQNNHLPDVPSADSVEKNGLDLGDNQATLLKKIEELTMYVIDLNKEVQKLKTENAVLKKKVASIRKK